MFVRPGEEPPATAYSFPCNDAKTYFSPVVMGIRFVANPAAPSVSWIVPGIPLG
ncbi:hypothetical protein [Aquimarina megaterium]|uniref:hypothetical protein n=1 Tax=Aquimarina megaterium TaxID=1443666 RepID=UPI0013625D92|nr:hypothetical protein [Aquimarina megaterium]